jgi:hypothetical protein
MKRNVDRNHAMGLGMIHGWKCARERGEGYTRMEIEQLQLVTAVSLRERGEGYTRMETL